MKLLSLFSGIGAFENALERKGIDFELVNYCEFDKYASKSYSLIHNVPEVMNLGDITKVKIDELEPYSADLITYGFPCQDISNAGKQRGFEHDGQLTRSGLFFYAAAIIGRIQPKVAICENVKALVGKKFTKEFETVLSTLEDMGYTNYWQVLNAKDYGIPQNRERVFIVSIRNDIDKKYTFPAPIKLELRLKDILEKEVEEKYYLKGLQDFFIKNSFEQEIKGNGFRFSPHIKNNADIAKTITTHNGSRMDDNYVIDVDSEDAFFKFDSTNEKINMIGMLDIKGNEQVRRVYGTDGLSPTLNTMQGGNRQPKVLVREATKKGYAEAVDGDSINLEQPNSKIRRGRVGKQVAQTLNTAPQQAVVEPSLRIRKLTPKECFRLMGFDDADIDVLIENGISNTQLYKQAGNSIVVNVLEAILDNLVDVFDV